MQKKDLLRKKYFSKRKKNYFDIKLSYFYPLIKLIKKNFTKKNVNIFSYYPTSFEVNVLRLFEIEMMTRLKIFIPSLIKNNKMHFHQWNQKDLLQINKFGILEPILPSKQIIPDIILVPLLAYDNKKNRLGYGKGYYDRYLKTYLKSLSSTLTVGIAFSFQKYKKLPTSINDMRLNFILTEKGLLQ